MARDSAYKRDLKRAVGVLVPIKRFEMMNTSHIRIVVQLPDERELEVTASGSPRDHQHAINAVVRTIKQYMKGTRT